MSRALLFASSPPSARLMHRPRLPALSPNQPAMSRPTLAPSASPTTATVPGYHSSLAGVILLSAIFFVIGFLSIYLLRDLSEHVASTLPAHRGGGALGVGTQESQPVDGHKGLNQEALTAFPVRRYSSLKSLQEGIESEIECTICIAEFEDDDPVRLLTACNHSFHQGCIDQWLASHASCPVCRCDLRGSPGRMAETRQGTVGSGGEEAMQP